MYYYYADGDNKLIRVDVGDSKPSIEVFTASPGQLYIGDGEWMDPEPPGRNLATEALYSGDYYGVDETEAQRVMGVIDARVQAARGDR
ncbi:hypothetical protein M1247_34235 [Mycobacterium sp. 21AC1]|uniref:hypothetical protein n=1 Tax=[Mycobacterium] appelbergii TaxID=2939269 RepID=UPI00293911F5|nr:hypothetical protein [Mycobacterium sp. 21AC1]MDV3130005.1 hypothetical protein [Mycobacterium sp. 21AC1]